MAVFQQDPGTKWWTATIEEDGRVVSQGRTLQQAYVGVRRALNLVRPDLGRVQIMTDIRWSPFPETISEDVVGHIKRAAAVRLGLLSLQDELRHVTREAVQLLAGDRTYREIGQLLGIAHQRVEQIFKEEPLRNGPGEDEVSTGEASYGYAHKAG
jgi:hypothetical protein